MDFVRERRLDEPEDVVTLVLAAKTGDRRALDSLITRFGRVVFCIVYKRLRNQAEAEEVCQDVFIQVMLKIGQLNDPACFAGWVRQIAARLAINRATRNRPMLSIDDDDFGSAFGNCETPLGRILAEESRAQVREAVNGLSDMDRQTLEAFYFDGRSLLEMSDAFDSPVGTIKRRLHTARKRLAKQLDALAPA